MSYKKTSADYEVGSRRYEIALLAESGLNRAAIYVELRPLVVAQTEPFVFKANNPVKGRPRLPKSLRVQFIELRNEIGRVLAEMDKDREDHSRIPDENPPNEPPQSSETPEIPEDEDSRPDSEIPEPPKPEATGKRKLRDEVAFLLREVNRLRKFCEDRDLGTDKLDEIGMRPAIDGTRAVLAGIPAKAMLHAMTLHWGSDVREVAGVEDFDFEAFSPSVGSQYHKMTGYCLMLAKAGIPIMLVGPTGTGKSFLRKSIAAVLELETAYVGLVDGATPSWLCGSITMDGFVTRPHLEILKNGGVFAYEEIDAADANVLLVVNNILTEDEWFNPVNGEKYVKHPDFVPIAMANTDGSGGTKHYSGRNKLDGATLDRFRMGRVLVNIDVELQDRIVWGMVENHLHPTNGAS